jgi:hypothetical protein
MKQLTEKEKAVFGHIDFYNRYEALSKKYSFEKSFEKYSNAEVLNVIAGLGYKAR